MQYLSTPKTTIPNIPHQTTLSNHETNNSYYPPTIFINSKNVIDRQLTSVPNTIEVVKISFLKD